MKDTTTEPPVPPRLRELYESPSDEELAAQRALEEQGMAQAEALGCPAWLRERGVRPVANAYRYFYKRTGRWPARAIADHLRFRGGVPELVDRGTTDPQVRVLSIWRNGRWDKTAAARRNHHIHGDPLPDVAPAVMKPAAAVASPRERRARRASNPTRAGPDDDGEPSEHEPPARRFCICGCGRDISHKRADAVYFDPDACRKRHKRALERERSRAERPGIDRHRRDPYEELATHEYDALRKRVNEGCHCNGHHIADGPDHCVKCGHELLPPAFASHGEGGIPARTFLPAHGLRSAGRGSVTAAGSSCSSTSTVSTSGSPTRG